LNKTRFTLSRVLAVRRRSRLNLRRRSKTTLLKTIRKRYHKTKTQSIKSNYYNNNNNNKRYYSIVQDIILYYKSKNKTNKMATQEYDRMLETLREVNTLCAKAQGHYHAAMGFEANANHADQKAKFGAMWDGNGLFEKHDQHVRAKKMNHAKDESNRGTEELRRVFSLIPRDRPCLLRERYPEEMSRIGTIPIPEMEGGHFGGAMMMDMAGGRRGFGAEMNAQHAQREIDRNLECIRQCEIICAEQQQSLGRLTERVRADRDGRTAPPAREQERVYTAATQEGGGYGYAPERAMPVTPYAPEEVYVDGGGMGMDGGMDGGMGGGGMGMRGGGGGGGMGMGMVEGMMMEEMIVDDRRRDEFRRDERRRDEFGGRDECRRDERRRDEFGGRDEFRRDDHRRDEFGGRDDRRRR
jgi:hypothetical protein